MLAPKEAVKTPPTANPSDFDLQNIRHAIFQAEQGLEEQGVPIGAALVRKDGVVIGVGRNRRVQQKSATRHGETDCLECIGRLPASVYKDCTTLSPCSMCSGAMILFGIKRCVMGENDTFLGGESILQAHGVEVVNLNLDSCKKLMATFIEKYPEVWNEDIGEEDK
ncbi:Cytosine deaminase [Rhodotorula toruloides ATCC 204091]|uniref:Cytosine deaminase n=1 Tax=Rhodotorula toruloides TaxID=5286 RepID=A0A0K3CFL8_RHOTO|nr:Cytosine deaminase [Rhodotorula toruloides ATCC 204091]PRQ74206.1 cytosine deaminase [Rhodotorula toruloides]